MRIVVTGKTGQVVQSLLERGPGLGAEIVPLGRPELDLAQAARALDLIAAAKPDLVVSAAAYTAVDKAESEPELAFAVNADGPRAIGAAASLLGVPLIHISTDYVFDGSKATPWTEDDTPGPIGVYGTSKLAGERAVLETCPRSAILRIGWVYSPFGGNFAKTILRLAGERDRLRIVGDQTGSPSSALDVADGVLRVARNLIAEPDRKDLLGVFHMGAGGEATWAEFAAAICDWLAETKGRKVTVEKITTAEYPTAARRPQNSRLDSRKLAAVHGYSMPPWRQSLPAVLNRLA